MANTRTYAPRAEDLLRYSFETGEATGSKDNQIRTNEGRERQGARAQEASIAAAQFRQHAADRTANLQSQAQENAMRLRANMQDNAAALQGKQIDAQSDEANRLAGFQEIEMRGDIDARNKALEGTGGLADATDGPIQELDHALDNQQLYQTATARDRHALQQKFAAGDPQAVQAAIASGRAQLSRTDDAALKKAQAALSRADNDPKLHPAQRVAVQKQKALEIQGIMRRAQWKPDEQQPKTLQEEAQSRVITLTDVNGKRRSAYIDPKTGKPIPLHTLDPEVKPDPNAPKPPKVLSADEKKLAFRKEWNAAAKALQTQHPVTGAIIHADATAIRAHMQAADDAFNEINAAEEQKTVAEGAAVVSGFGSSVRDAVTGFDPAKAAMKVLAPSDGKGPIKVAGKAVAPVGTATWADGKKYPIVNVPVAGSDKPVEAVFKDGEFHEIVKDDKGNMKTGRTFTSPKYDAKSKPKTAKPNAVYVHSNDDAGAERAWAKGLQIYDEHGNVAEKP